MPAVADITRSRRQRAGSRRNKRLKNVGSFASDHRSGGTDLQTVYNRAMVVHTTVQVPAIIPIHQDHLHMNFLERLTGIKVRRTKTQRGAAIHTRQRRGE